ncbi:family 78 glycoside hydrolase catalytic domain [Mediterraneibacter gnavus]|uniref:family 78 glycoside hydrolase catalytic domain n=1 Tax=Mediterraneibacter gnavus TaxID=33038 RepID=UPI00232FA90E|nr:family 78 glycoside hydrolase catalytic domain [Mediterraneibacter gnavus]MDB8709935.1 family 78 glycoside hydrolase catalytic domain [Mediterraneibacter gnavus]MDB8712897.1 family 78 glycoside hydrolase catalytic domain [Mediterraneibacter gnavus]
MKLYDLRTEYRVNPIGIAEPHPRFSWKLESEENNTVQQLYHIIVNDEKTVVWEVTATSEDSVLIVYAGDNLQDETLYHVTVEVTDNHGNIAKGEMSFETGILDPEVFQAKMITHDFPEEETACPIFSRTFAAKGNVKKARIYATSRGVYEAYLNGKRIKEERMTPGWTSYHHRLQYQIYDITEMIQQENKVEIMVGNGWYKGIFGFMLTPNIYGDRVGAFVEIHMEYEDGSSEIICTDETWQVQTGEIRYSEIYMGETIDTTVCKESNAENSRIRIGTVSVLDFDKQTLTAQENEPIRITERIPAKELIVTPKGEKLVDFGQNLTGLVEVKVHGRKGQKIVIRHAEVLDKEGNFYPETLRQAKSEDTYICNGEEQTFLPHFTFHGFRYICVEGLDDLTLNQFTACVMHSDMEKLGDFQCSNRKVNQLQHNIAWGQRGNFLDIPTDCPQRDERLGWTGDAQIFSWTAAFNRNTALFFRKWMRDVAAESSLEKGVPHVVPDILGSYSSSAWSDVAVIVPWVVYQTYGDKGILEENWKCMHEWVDYIKNQCGENGLWQTGYQYGDWLALDKEESADRTGATDKYMIANAYYLYVTNLVKQTAEVLGFTENAEKYQKLYDTTLEAFRQEYYTNTGRIVSETQTGAILSLYFNLAREKDRTRILQTLKTNIENHKNHLATGFVGTPYLCHALSENGEHKLAGTIFMKEDYPSWFYAVNMGATTIWERWNSIMPDGSFDASGMNSLNHYAYGSIGDWMYRKVAGVSQLKPGYKKFKVQPMFVKGIEEAGAEFESAYGKIESKWSCKDGKIHGYVKVPANTTAEIHLPEKEDVITVGSGIYEYEYETTTNLAYERFSLDSTFGEILSQPLAVDLFNQMSPGSLDNPMLVMAQQMTLAEVLSVAPEARPLYEAVVNALNVAEK